MKGLGRWALSMLFCSPFPLQESPLATEAGTSDTACLAFFLFGLSLLMLCLLSVSHCVPTVLVLLQVFLLRHSPLHVATLGFLGGRSEHLTSLYGHIESLYILYLEVVSLKFNIYQFTYIILIKQYVKYFE